MKTIITTTALSLAISATAAFANTNSAIAGSSGTLPSECSFVASSDGTMAREADKWVTTTRGTFTVKVRGAVADLSVTSDGILRDAGGASTGVLLDVDYTQSNDFVMLSNTGGGSWTLNLPSPVAQSFRTIQFISDDTTFGANTIILDAGSGFLIDDAQTFTINRKFEAITVFSDGSNWIITQAKV